MRVYDISLAVVQTLAAVEFVRAALGFVFNLIRFSFLIGAASNSAWLTRVELTTWMGPFETLIMGYALIMLRKPIARFASNFASHSDAAAQF